MKIRSYPFIAGIILLISLICFGCSSAPSAPNVQVPFVPVPGSSPVVQITQPSDQAVVNGVLNIMVTFSNFAMVDANGAENADGQGHMTFCILDADPVNQSQEETPLPPPFVITGGGSCAFTSGSFVLQDNLPAGNYQLKAELVNNDGTELDTPVIDTIFVTVGPGSHKVNLLIYQK
jgi:hypothetical protein